MRKLLLILALVLLAGCAAEEGQITDKKYHGAYDSYGNTCVSYNSNGLCQFSVPQTYHHPEEFCFELDDGTWERCVPKDMWDRYKIGDYFPGVGKA
jgi:hypothetical protein